MWTRNDPFDLYTYNFIIHQITIYDDTGGHLMNQIRDCYIRETFQYYNAKKYNSNGI